MLSSYFLYHLFGLLPRPLALVKGRVLGRLAWWFDDRGRNRTLTHIAIAYGETLPPRKRRALGRAAYRNLALNLVDLCRVARLSDEAVEELVTDEDRPPTDTGPEPDPPHSERNSPRGENFMIRS